MIDASSANKTVITHWLNDPYLLGSLSLTIINLLSVLLGLMFVFCRLSQIKYFSLFLIEMAVGSLMSDAIMYLLPSVIIAESVNLRRPKGVVPFHFPRLAVIVGSVCLLHALDTASVVFFGRAQSRSHAIEWRNSHQRQRRLEELDDLQELPEQTHQQQEQHQGQICSQDDAESDLYEAGVSQILQNKGSNKKNCEPDVITDESEDSSDGSDARSGRGTKQSIRFEDGFTADIRGRFRTGLLNLQQAFANPKLFLQPGPYRLCSIMSAGAILHSFANGVALGAGFVKSWKTGLHLSLSVGLHELAHNVAEFAVLTASGFSLVCIILMNALNLIASFLGVFISVPLSRNSHNFWAWLMTVVTAVFVYLALVTMSSLVRKNYLPTHTKAFIIGNAALTTGSLVTVLASATEYFFEI